MRNSEEIALRVQQAKNHYSHPSFIFGDVVLTGHELLDEYLASLAQTLIFGFTLYFIVSSLSYWIFFVKYKSEFTPLH